MNTTTTHYRTTTYWLCWPCEQQRRKTIRSVVLAVVVGFGVLIGLAAIGTAFGDHSHRPQTVASPESAHPSPASNADATESEPIDSAAEPPAVPAAATDDSANQAAADADSLLSQLPTMLTGDVRKALNKNETRLWHMNGMRGYVLLSGDSAESAAACKNVVITLITGREQRQTEPKKWCHSSDGDDWHPA